MSEHKLIEGKQLIRSLAALGEVLGYHVEKEFPVDTAERGTPPAVDVAWFTEKDQRFPLFIFEVESRPSNTIANNPLKVFAQETQQFEKPLFFFQVVASGSKGSSRIRNVQNHYGSYNYRLYVLGKDDGNTLLVDIFSQHRRIRNDIDYVELYHLLVTDGWRSAANVYKALDQAYVLGLSQNARLASYVKLCGSDPQMLTELKDALSRGRSINSSSLRAFPSYLGSQWGTPILCALMIGSVGNDAELDHWNRELMRWQENGGGYPMITASFGLSWDYDQFLLGVAAPLVTLCCALAGEKAHFRSVYFDILVDIVVKLRGWYTLHSALWLAHLSARYDSSHYFDIARRAIDELGGVREEALLCPPSFISSEIEEADAFPPGNKVNCPTLEEFQATMQHSSHTANPETVAVRALDEDMYMHQWAEDLVAALWSRSLLHG